jgi:hypothetical protein
MGFQTAVQLQQGFGVPGELFTDGPYRAESFIINSASAAYNIIGATVCTVSSQGVVAAGGTGAFAGFLVNPKGQALLGTSSGTLNPSLTVPNYTQVEVLSMGTIIVTLPAAAAIGDLVLYNTTTGALSTMVNGGTPPGGTAYANAWVDYYTVGGAGLAVITVNPAIAVIGS